MSESKNMIAGLYDLGETIGEGHYAVVKLAKHVFTGEKVAVKVIDKMKLDQSTRTQMMQEVRLMKLVQHPNVVRLYEVGYMLLYPQTLTIVETRFLGN